MPFVVLCNIILKARLIRFQRYQRFVGTNPEQEVAQQGAHLHAEREGGQDKIRGRVCEAVLPLLYSAVSLLCSAIYAQCPYDLVLYIMQSVLIM